jgi:hypothetical protein
MRLGRPDRGHGVEFRRGAVAIALSVVLLAARTPNVFAQAVGTAPDERVSKQALEKYGTGVDAVRRGELTAGLRELDDAIAMDSWSLARINSPGDPQARGAPLTREQ